MAIIIDGNVPLRGTVSASGSKNSAIKLVFASMFSNEDVILDNVPRAESVLVDLEIIKSVGGKAEWVGNNKILLNGGSISSYEIPYEIGSKYRAAFLFAGPLLYRFGKANIPKFETQLFSPSPLNRIVDTWKQLGFDVEEDAKYYFLSVTSRKQADLSFKTTSHTGTDNAILSSLFIDGDTYINNASEEPEIEDLLKFCVQIGANVSRVEPRKIKITGASVFSGTQFAVQYDKSEVATFCTAAIITGGNIVVKNVNKLALVGFLSFLSKVGVNYEFVGDELRVWQTNQVLNPTNVTVSASPGFVADWQALAVLILSKAQGESMVHDTVYYNRFGYVQDLNRMGADIELIKPSQAGLTPVISDDSFHFEKTGEPFSAVRIKGPAEFSSQKIHIIDPRFANTLVLAGLSAKGRTEISNYTSLYETNEGFFDKLINLGAKISRT